MLASLLYLFIGSDSARAGLNEISEVKLTGVSAETAALHRAELATQSGHIMRPKAIAADLKRLWSSGLYNDVRADFDPDTGSVEFALEPLASIASIAFDRPSSHSDNKRVRQLIQLRVGDRISAAAVHAAELRVVGHFASVGYPRAAVKLRLVPTANGSRALRVDIRTGERIRRVSVDFIGNHDQSDKQLRKLLDAGIETTAEENLNSKLEAQRQRLVDHYHSRGFADVRIDRPLRGWKASQRTRAVRFRISEGERYSFGAVSMPTSLPASLPADETLARSPSGPFDAATVTAMTARITSSLQEGGFAFATVTPALSLDRARKQVSVRFVVEPGVLARVERIEIRGNSKTVDSVIRRELDIEVGKRLTSSAIRRSVARLERLGFFDNVSVDVSEGAERGAAVVVFAVEERLTGQFVIGAGISGSDGFIASATVGQKNLFGRGHSLSLAARLSARESIFALRFRNPALFDSDWSAGAEVYNTSQARPGSTRQAIGGAITVGHELTDTLRASLTGRVEQVTAVEPEVLASAFAPRSATERVNPTELYRDGLIASLRGTFASDDRRTRGWLPWQSRLGTHAGVYGEIATNLLESGGSHQRVGAWVDHHEAIGGSASARFRGSVDWIGSSESRGVPLFERFFAGGMHDVRGYAPLSLGASIFTSAGAGDPLHELAIGGNLRILASAELSFPIASAVGLSGVVFADAGNVFNLERRYCRAAIGSNACPSAAEILTGMRASVGVGARWASPLGPLRFEWGIPLTRRPGQPPVRFHFGFGPR